MDAVGEDDPSGVEDASAGREAVEEPESDDTDSLPTPPYVQIQSLIASTSAVESLVQENDVAPSETDEILDFHTGD